MYNLLKIHFHALNIDKASDSDGQMQHTTSLSYYIRSMAESKMWFSTLSQGLLLPQRTFEVLASGRAVLLMNRPTDPRITTGILTEGEDCVMFNTTEELVAKVVYYATHEDERLVIVSNALKRARQGHYWSHRADMIKFLIDNMNCGV